MQAPMCFIVAELLQIVFARFSHVSYFTRLVLVLKSFTDEVESMQSESKDLKSKSSLKSVFFNANIN